MKRLLLAGVLSLASAEAWAGCTLKCISRNPFNGRCLAKMKVCDPPSFGDINRRINEHAFSLASAYERSNPNADVDDCVTVVAAGLVAWGAAEGNAIGAALAAGAGIPAARLACRRVF